MNRLGEHYNRYHNQQLSESNNLQYQNNDIARVYKSESFSVNQEPDIEYEEVKNYLVITSKTRDLNTYPKANYYAIDLMKEYKNVSSIELIQAILPDKNNITSEPYILLNIEELDKVMECTERNIEGSFAILQLNIPVTTGGFIEIRQKIHEQVVLKFLTPKARLSKMTVSLTDADGVPFDFGGDGTNTKAYQNTFVFRVITLEKKRRTLNVRNVY
jgi:hypothetical protein